MHGLWELFLIALRNVARNKARSALTLGAIGFGVMMTVVLGGFSRGLTAIMEDDTILGRTGALQVHRRGYFDVKDNQPLKLSLPAAGELEQRIASTPGVSQLTPRILFAGILNNGTLATTVIVQAIDPVRERLVLPARTGTVVGREVSPDSPSGALLVAELAKALAAPPGTSLVLQAAAPDGRENALDLDVVGTINNSNAVEPKKVLYLPLAFAQRLLGMEGRVTEWVLAVPDRDHLEQVKAELERRLGPDYEVQTWRQVRPNLADVIRFLGIVFGAVCGVFLLIAAFGVANTMLMSVAERTREIGTMMAVGVRRGRIALLFLLEALCLASVGGLAGAALGAGVVAAVAARGGIPGGAPGSTMVMYIIPRATPGLLALALGAAALSAVAASLYPALRAARLNPIEALRAT